MIVINIRNGIGIAAPKNANSHQFKYFPAKKQTRIPESNKFIFIVFCFCQSPWWIIDKKKRDAPVFPKAVGKSPNVPRTSGCTVSPKYTGSERDNIPTHIPAMARPTNT